MPSTACSVEEYRSYFSPSSLSSSAAFFFFFFPVVVLRTRTFGNPSGLCPSIQRSSNCKRSIRSPRLRTLRARANRPTRFKLLSIVTANSESRRVYSRHCVIEFNSHENESSIVDSRPNQINVVGGVQNHKPIPRLEIGATMPRLFLPNFEFEHRLGPNPIQTVSRKILRLNAEFSTTWVVCAEPGDRIWMNDQISDTFLDGLERAGLPRIRSTSILPPGFRICPWGWDSHALAQVHLAQVQLKTAEIDAPPLDVVEQVNSRHLSFDLESEFDCGLHDAVRVVSIEALADAIRNIANDHGRWVVKAEFSMSARERIVGTEPQFSESQTNWARRRLVKGAALFVEPWVNVLDEYGSQFEIPRNGPPVHLGTTRLLTDQTGGYCGSVVAHEQTMNQRLIALKELGLLVARRIQQLGYFGPLGIDSAVYQDPRDEHSEPRLRPIQDINARFTMGRLCLGLRRLLQAGEQARWVHGAWPTSNATDDLSLSEAVRVTEPDARLVTPTTPFAIGHQPTHHGTWIVIERQAALATDTVIQTRANTAKQGTSKHE